MGRKRSIVKNSDIQNVDALADVFSRGRRITKRVRQFRLSVLKGRVEITETITTIEPREDSDGGN